MDSPADLRGKAPVPASADQPARGVAGERAGINDTAPDAIEQLSDDLAKQVNRQAGQMQHGQQIKPITIQQTTIRLTEPTWSPTELGEKILAFFAEAGTEPGQA